MCIDQVMRRAAMGNPKEIQSTVRAGAGQNAGGASHRCDRAYRGTEPSLLTELRAAKPTQHCWREKEHQRFEEHPALTSLVCWVTTGNSGKNTWAQISCYLQTCLCRFHFCLKQKSPSRLSMIPQWIWFKRKVEDCFRFFFLGRCLLDC